MTRLTHDEFYLSQLAGIAARGTCSRRQVGAIIVDNTYRVLSTGYNGVPRKFPHCTDEPCAGAQDPAGDTRRCMAVHAEINALLQCTKPDDACTMYVSCVPCFECAKAIANSELRFVICLEPYPGRGTEVLEQAGIQVRIAKF